MKPRRARPWIPWSIFVVGLGLLVTSIYFGLDSAPYRDPVDRLAPLDIVWAVSIMTLPAAGAVIASRRPEQPIGWILTGMGFCLGLGLLGSEYASYAYIMPVDPSPLLPVAAFLSNWPFAALIGLAFFLLILFPTGRLPGRSRYWRWLSRSGAGALAGLVVCQIFTPGPLESAPQARNPLGIEVAGEILDLGATVSFALLDICLLLAAAAPFTRLRHGTGEERQQVKWFAAGAASLVIYLVLQALLTTLTDVSGERAEVMATLGFVAVMVVFSTSIVVSVLKYRLYDIDVVVNRTLVYGSLTMILALAYVGLTLLFRQVLPLEADSDIGVAASTLAVAGLFGPLRRRLQQFIDRRFYRSRYDATRTVEYFAATLRNEVELATVQSDFVNTIGRTLQPRHISLWMPARQSLREERS